MWSFLLTDSFVVGEQPFDKDPPFLHGQFRAPELLRLHSSRGRWSARIRAVLCGRDGFDELKAGIDVSPHQPMAPLTPV